MAGPVHIYQVFINVEPKVVWEAITDGEKTVKYFYGTRVESDWQPGSPINYYDSNGGVVADGKIISCEPPHRLEYTFQARWDPDLIAEGPAREAWVLDDVNGATKLTIELYDVEAGSKTYDDFVNGFPYIVSGLKTLVETGESLPMPY